VVEAVSQLSQPQRAGDTLYWLQLWGKTKIRSQVITKNGISMLKILKGLLVPLQLIYGWIQQILQLQENQKEKRKRINIGHSRKILLVEDIKYLFDGHQVIRGL
jgi:hypothetical protein